MSESKSEIKRWTAKRKTQVVVDILKRKIMLTEAARHMTSSRRKSSAGWGTASPAWRTAP